LLARESEDALGVKLAFVPKEVFARMDKQQKYAVAKLREKTRSHEAKAAANKWDKMSIPERKKLQSHQQALKQRPAKGRKAYLGTVVDEFDSDNHVSAIPSWGQDPWSDSVLHF